jgi:hypothetical protein
MVNNCVGWNNYSDFIILIITSLILVSFKLILELIKLIMIGLNYSHFKWVNFGLMKMEVKNSIILLTGLTIVDVILYAYFAKLALLHFYLYRKGLSMY